MTLGSGRGFIHSETTVVSSKKLTGPARGECPGLAQRRSGKKFRKVSNAAGLALPFFSRDDNRCELAVTGNGLRAAGSGAVEHLAKFSFGFSYSPLALGHGETSRSK